MKILVLVKVKGGKGSGNFGHCGRPGEVGGSSDICTMEKPATSKKAKLLDTIDQLNKSQHGGAGYFLLPNDKLVDVSDEYGAGTNDHVGYVIAMEDPETLGVDKQLARRLLEVNTRLGDASLSMGQWERLQTKWDTLYGQLWDSIRESGTVRVRMFGKEAGIDYFPLNSTNGLRRFQDLVNQKKLPGKPGYKYTIDTGPYPMIFSYEDLMRSNSWGEFKRIIGIKEKARP